MRDVQQIAMSKGDRQAITGEQCPQLYLCGSVHSSIPPPPNKKYEAGMSRLGRRTRNDNLHHAIDTDRARGFQDNSDLCVFAKKNHGIRTSGLAAKVGGSPHGP
jgi:hypothetical protein